MLGQLPQARELVRGVGVQRLKPGLGEILLAEAPDGFIVQGIVGHTQDSSQWSDPSMTVTKETYTFLDEDIAKFLEDSQARRRPAAGGNGSPMAGPYERTLRVIGRYIDDQKPKDIFFFEQEGAYVLRMLMNTRQGSKHQLAEFTRDDLESMIRQGPALRGEQGASPPQ